MFSADYTKILVIGGYNDELGSYVDTVEVVDLLGENSDCAPIAPYPIPIAWAAGAIIDGRPRVCGGEGPFTDQCYQYLYESNQWENLQPSLQEARSDAGSGMVNSATWLITGGWDGIDPPTDTTEVWSSVDGLFLEFGPDLPLPLRGHCQVTLNYSYVFVLGGYDGSDYSLSFNVLDWDAEEWLEPLPDLPGYILFDACGLIQNPENGQELVVLASGTACYIFNFRNETWREGPVLEGVNSDLQESATAVQMGDNFLVLGGYLGDGVSTDTVYEFDQDNYLWIPRDSLSSARRGVIGIPVPDDMVNCS